MYSTVVYCNVLYYTVQHCIIRSVKGNQTLANVYKRLIGTTNIKFKTTE